MESTPLITINLVVLNGEKYICHCLDGILAQTYQHELAEVNILDNNSSDKTKEIIRTYNQRLTTNNFAGFNLIELKKNLGVWPAQEELLKYSNGKYILGLCVDVILDKDFVKNAVEIMEHDPKIGALQAKIYKYDISNLSAYKLMGLSAKIIDTCGFKIFKSRRVINIGHGETDHGQYDNLGEIFGVEGACPFFRREALEFCKIQQPTTNNQPIWQAQGLEFIEGRLTTEIFDHDYFWYGDDLDLAWRMNLFGWKQVFAPSVIAWHDRQTTKSVKKSWIDYILRVPIRHQIPIKKRRLDWRNTRFTIIKNDYIINILRDLSFILAREISVIGYAFLFEQGVLAEIPTFIKMLSQMLRKRKEIMKRAVIKPEEMRKWFK